MLLGLPWKLKQKHKVSLPAPAVSGVACTFCAFKPAERDVRFVIFKHHLETGSPPRPQVPTLDCP